MTLSCNWNIYLKICFDHGYKTIKNCHMKPYVLTSHPTHEQSRYSFSSVHNVELGNLMKEEEEAFSISWTKWLQLLESLIQNTHGQYRNIDLKMCSCPRFPKTALSLPVFLLEDYPKDLHGSLDPSRAAKHGSMLRERWKLHINQSVI